MSYIPNCREDENYNQKYLTGDDKEFVRGYDWCTERDLMYFVCDTSELLKGDILKRYQAYKTGLECNVLQIDEARYKEDLPPLGLNWIKLGLQDVLYDPKTKVIYTPNMNQSMQMSENQVSFGEGEVDKPADDGIMEERDNNYKQNPETGRMEGSYPEGSASGASDKSVKSGIEKTKYAPSERANKRGLTINPKTFVKVRSEFNTKFPDAEKGRTETVTKGSYNYNVTADGYGSVIINYRYKK